MTQTRSLTDADLLARYMQAGDEGAFTKLVRAHERLVIGTATRITGNAESARDVAQQGWMLTDRTCLAGWLHHAARHVALRVARSERARNRRHEQLTLDTPAAPESDVWPMLEEALATLPDAEREAVVMHHLQDRSYADMASALGLTEAAARKRVSRGVQNLGAQLRKRGFGGSAASLLAGATALQVGTPSVAVAATLTSAVPLSLTLTTLMAHTTVKLAAVIALVAAVPIALQTQANSSLRAELATLQQQPRPTAPKPLAVRDNADLRAEAARLNQRLAAARLAQTDLQTQLAAAQATAKTLREEVVISHGKIEDLARSMVKKMMPLMEAQAALEKLSESERAAKEAEFAAQMGVPMMELVSLQQTVLKLEDRPEDVALFYATAFVEAVNLPAALRPRLQSVLLADFEQLKRDGLSFSQVPSSNPETWLARRMAASEIMQKNIEDILPPQHRKYPIFEVNDGGFLGGLSIHELGYLVQDKRATPMAPVTKP